MKKKSLFSLLLAAILVLGFIVRLYRFDGPVADWHSWRQADTSAVSRNFVTQGFDILHPRFDDLSNVPSGMDNPQGYRFVEFPLYNIAQAGLFILFGGFTLEEWGRLVSIFSSLLVIVFLYLIISRHANKTVALIAAAFQALIPYNIYYSRTILPDTSMVMAVLGGIYFFDLWIEENVKKQKNFVKEYLYYLLAIIFTAAAMLLKPYAIFFVLPMFYLVWKAYGIKFLLKWQLWFFTITTLAPIIWWRIWMTHFPEGIPSNAWLLNGNNIRFKPSFFRWIFYERLTKLISGYLGIVIFIVGLYKLRFVKERLFFVLFIVGSLLYVFVFATGNVQHDYYQRLVIPSISIVFAFGSYYLYQWSIKKFPIGKMILLLCVVGGFYFGWMQVRDYFNINNPAIIKAGEAVDKLVPKDAKVIANYTGDTSFLYQTKRKGWASFQNPLPIMIQKGASYLILVNPTDSDRGLKKEYKVVAETKEYLIFNLRQKP